jgi:hypothetical protein
MLKNFYYLKLNDEYFLKQMLSLKTTPEKLVIPHSYL